MGSLYQETLRAVNDSSYATTVPVIEHKPVEGARTAGASASSERLGQLGSQNIDLKNP